MADRHLIDEIVAGGVTDRVDAEDMADRVLTAIAARVAAGRTVKIDGVGRLGSRSKWQDTFCRGPARVRVTVTCLKDPAELGRSDPVPAKGAGL